uniref:Galectin n=1 Tax=Sinocyclocheilus rhinocerous TaxID=307959 RepID=A0A673IP95_9TELE
TPTLPCNYTECLEQFPHQRPLLKPNCLSAGWDVLLVPELKITTACSHPPSCVVMNSVINGNLGTEESVSDNPFKKGQPFEMFTVIKSEGYKVYVNGKELCTFKHRIPLEKRDCCSLSLGVDQLWKPDGRF